MLYACIHAYVFGCTCAQTVSTNHFLSEWPQLAFLTWKKSIKLAIGGAVRVSMPRPPDMFSREQLKSQVCGKHSLGLTHRCV